MRTEIQFSAANSAVKLLFRVPVDFYVTGHYTECGYPPPFSLAVERDPTTAAAGKVWCIPGPRIARYHQNRLMRPSRNNEETRSEFRARYWDK
jgi:hypothetical protein